MLRRCSLALVGCLVGLLLTNPVRAGDTSTTAASDTVDAAAALGRAAEAARQAGQSEQQAANTGLQEGHSFVQEHVDNAAAAAKAADAAAAAAQQDTIDASAAAEKARAARQRAANTTDPTEKQKALDDEKKWANKAADLAKDAKSKADEAKSQADTAKEETRLADQAKKNIADNSGGVNTPPPAGSDQEKKLQKDKQEGKSIEDNNGTQGRKGTSQGVLKTWIPITEEEEANQQNQQNKPHDPEQMEIWVPIDLSPSPFHIDSFFDIFTVPLIRLPINLKDGRTELWLRNDNDFPVQITGVQVLLFGDAVTFDAATVFPELAAHSSAQVYLGNISAKGGPGAFTAADFNILTGPGNLGPDYSADFVVVPLPGSGWMGMAFLGVIVGWSSWRRRVRQG